MNGLVSFHISVRVVSGQLDFEKLQLQPAAAAPRGAGCFGVSSATNPSDVDPPPAMGAAPLPLLLLAAAPSAAAASSFRQTRFVIGGGPDPPPTNASYSNLHGASCSFVHADTNEVTSLAGAQAMAGLCAANNLSCALPLLAAKTVSAPTDNVWGFFVHDEPRAKDFPGLAQTVSSIRASHPGALSFVNLLGAINASEMAPGFAKQLYGVDTFEEYVDSFIATVKPDVLSYDCCALYPLGPLPPAC